MILFAVIVGIYLISVVGFYRSTIDAAEEDQEARLYMKIYPGMMKPLLAFLSFFWPLQAVWTYTRRGLARA